MKNGYLTESEAIELRNFFNDNIHLVTKYLVPDQGTCVIGNGIKALVIKKRCRKPVKMNLFYNSWTQVEQPQAIKELIKLAKIRFPEYVTVIEYDQGKMD